ncbi:DNA adenine methylase [uncultured Intestinimonas sp.]|uniref:DNA adenine methylase n=1 Tax=uncultured Intestinimonas sp. TaxID=1689265 RepID=UPI0025D94B45|nr:DNA adenine methylase [uncultured Intestinimonas sp.]
MGGKEKLAPYVCQVLPPRFSPYIEPYGGGGAVLLGLPRDPGRLDIYNDYDGDLVNLMACVRDRPLALLKELKFLPILARGEFELLKRILRHDEILSQALESEREIARTEFPPEQAEELLEILREKAAWMDVRRAAAYYLTSRYSFSGTRSSFGVRAVLLDRFFGQIQEASRRLQGVVIENKDGVDLIRERDEPSALFYCDPPYYQAERCYQARFARWDHARLHHVLRQCQGYAAVSYNDCPYIRSLYKDFYILAFRRQEPLAQREGAEYGELILTNYDPRPFLRRQVSLFDSPAGDSGMELVHIPESPLKIIA